MALPFPTPDPGSYDPLEYPALSAGAIVSGSIIITGFVGSGNLGTNFGARILFLWSDLMPYAGLSSGPTPDFILVEDASNAALDSFHLVCTAVFPGPPVVYQFDMMDSLGGGKLGRMLVEDGLDGVLAFSAAYDYQDTDDGFGYIGYFLGSQIAGGDIRRFAPGNGNILAPFPAVSAGMPGIDTVDHVRFGSGGMDLRYQLVVVGETAPVVIWHTDFDQLAPETASSIPAVFQDTVSLSTITAEFRGALWPPDDPTGAGIWMEDTTGDEIGTIAIGTSGGVPGLVWDTSTHDDGLLQAIFAVPGTLPADFYSAALTRMYVPDDLVLEFGFTVLRAEASLVVTFGLLSTDLGFEFTPDVPGSTAELHAFVPHDSITGITAAAGFQPIALGTLYRLRFTYENLFPDPDVGQFGGYGRWHVQISDDVGATWADLVDQNAEWVGWARTRDGCTIAIAQTGDGVVVYEDWAATAVGPGLDFAPVAFRAA